MSGSNTEKPANVGEDNAPLPAALSEPTYDEGGLQGWLVTFGAFCSLFSVFGTINSAGVFESYFATHQLKDKTPSQIGWVFSLYLFITFFVGVQAGPVFDRHGPRMLIAVGSILSIASWMILGECKEYYQIILDYSVLGGISGALIHTPSFGAVAHFFNRRRSLATGLASSSGGLAGVVLPLMLRHLFPSIGFAWSTRILGFITMGLSVLANTFIRAKLPPSKQVTSVWPDLSIFRNPRLALCTMGIFFLEWGLFVPLTYIVSFAIAHGQGISSAYTVLTVLNAGSLPGRVLPGFLADRFGRFNVLITTTTLCIILVFALWFPAGSSKPMLFVFAALFGFTSGSNLSLIPPCVGQLCETKNFGGHYATAMMFASFGTLTGAPIGGALLGTGNDWKALIIFSGLSYTVALFCFGTLRILVTAWKLRAVF